MPHTLVLAGGGTGGHVYPAIAMGDALRARGHGALYYGDAARLEGRVAAERGYTFRGVDARAFPRGGVLGKLRFAVDLLRAVAGARRLLLQDRATLVLGVGGYVMAPTVLAAWSLGIPTAIHEANVTPGLANRLCARVARLVLLTYAETAARLPGNADRVTVGCPVNPKVLTGDRAAALARYGLSAERRTLLVVGGSLGAATINEIGRASAADGGFQVIHVAGPRYLDEVRAAYGTVPPHVALVGYEDRMADAYAAADLVVCRAGSSTLAELCAIGKPSMLVPSPNVTDNHQEGNARGLERAGAAQVVVEKGLDVKAVVRDIAATLADGARLEAMAAAARTLGRTNAAEEVADLLLERFPVP
jgi:UDP-N-acetylglucosamine--N-acetylmuramyl-(pentapeptide) pyrophosphoryl-undecaprenol N-acetylglucosamine transferase